MAAKDRARWAVAAAVLLAAVGWVGYRLATATTRYTYRLAYATMPADDEALAAWLKGQPGVSRPSVAREGSTLVVEFTLRAARGGPAPDVAAEAGRLGYSGLSGFNVSIAGGFSLW